MRRSNFFKLALFGAAVVGTGVAALNAYERRQCTDQLVLEFVWQTQSKHPLPPGRYEIDVDAAGASTRCLVDIPVGEGKLACEGAGIELRLRAADVVALVVPAWPSRVMARIVREGVLIHESAIAPQYARAKREGRCSTLRVPLNL